MALIAAWLRAELRALAPRAALPGARASLWLLFLVGVVALVGALADPHRALWTAPEAAQSGPTASHWLGTDHLGRDVGWRLVFATSTFVLPAALSGVVAVGLGGLGGLVVGADRRGATLTRLTLVAVAALPAPVWVVLAGSIAGTDPWTVAITWGLASAPASAAAVQRRIEDLVRSDFVNGLVAAGLSQRRIHFVHLLLYASARILCREALLAVAGFLVVDAAMGYLGASAIREPQPTWGNMLVFQWGRGGHPVSWLAPVLALVATLAALHRTARLFAETRRV